MKKIFTLILISTLITGCANMKESLISGVSIGVVGGGAIGNAYGTGRDRDKSTRNGAIIGALLGAGLSYIIHKDKKKKVHKMQQKLLNNSTDVPLLTRPKVKRVWAPDKINGKRFIKGHWEYVIQEQSTWSQQ